MTSRDFCYWLQGYFEIGGVTHDTLSEEQVSCIQKHLAMVFVHEIDPSMGPPAHQVKLDAIHGTGNKPPGQVTQSVEPFPPYQQTSTGGPVFRC